MSDKKSTTGGIGFFGLLQVALIVLKLCGVINCSWVAVFIPVFIWVGIVVSVIGIVFIILRMNNRV